MDRAKIISVVIESGSAGLYHATSPQIEGLFISSETIDELKEIVPLAIEALFKAEGEVVSVIEADDDGLDIPMPWVVLRKRRDRAVC